MVNLAVASRMKTNTYHEAQARNLSTSVCFTFTVNVRQCGPKRFTLTSCLSSGEGAHGEVSLALGRLQSAPGFPGVHVAVNVF